MSAYITRRPFTKKYKSNQKQQKYITAGPFQTCPGRAANVDPSAVQGLGQQLSAIPNQIALLAGEEQRHVHCSGIFFGPGTQIKQNEAYRSQEHV